MAPSILRAFLKADPDLIELRIEDRDDELPIHCCIRNGKNPNILEFLSILFEMNHDLANASIYRELLPIHLAALYSAVEVVQMLYECSPSSINVIAPGYGSVANIAARNQKLGILKYIFGFQL